MRLEAMELLVADLKRSTLRMRSFANIALLLTALNFVSASAISATIAASQPELLDLVVVTLLMLEVAFVFAIGSVLVGYEVARRVGDILFEEISEEYEWATSSPQALKDNDEEVLSL